MVEIQISSRRAKKVGALKAHHYLNLLTAIFAISLPLKNSLLLKGIDRFKNVRLSLKLPCKAKAASMAGINMLSFKQI